MAFDSTEDMTQHRERVSKLLHGVAEILMYVAIVHDITKLFPEEKPYYDRQIPLLKAAKFGSEEYKEAARGLGPALEHHYANNRHHPQHFPNGVQDMDMIDLIEMMADWKAAGEREGGTNDLRKSIEWAQGHYAFSLDLRDLLLRTAERLGWL